MSGKSIEDKLKSLEGSYLFIIEMQKISRKAAGGDSAALNVLRNMLLECRDGSAWRKRGYWCSASLRALIATESDESLKIVTEYIENLSEDITFGGIELISTLLPLYGKKIVPELLSGKRFIKSAPGRAIRIQALCNIYLEGRLNRTESNKFEKLIKDYKPDRYMTLNLVELARGKLVGVQESIAEDEMADLLNDVIVEK